MSENLTLVSDLALIFISAGITTIIFKALKQPLILGYIVAGFLVGPHFGLFPGVTSHENVEQWSEIGIIFLLFALGLEFSFKKLLKVGSSALITAGTIFVGMFATGIGIGSLLGWSNMECIFLGGMLSMSSTTIIIKAFDDLGLKGKPFTSVVFGTLVVEDLLAVVLMVLLSTMAVSRQFAGKEMLFALAKLLFFIILWFLVGMYLIPTLFKKARKVMNEETLIILSVGLCFGMVIIASLAGFSSALGAFIMGSLLAETIEGEHISNSIKGIKDLFGAVFFVSVGMMVDPQIIVQYWKPILILTIVVMLFIPTFATLGVLLAGKGLHSAVRSGMSMAQIGEFAFIIASLGSSLGVMAPHIYPVIVAVSVITTFTTPYFIKLSEPLSIWLGRKLPPKILNMVTPAVDAPKTKEQRSDWNQLLKIYWTRVVVYTVMLVAIFLASNMYLQPFVYEKFTHLSKLAANSISAGITLATMSPFIIGLVSSPARMRHLFQKIWQNGSIATRGPLIAFIILKIVLGVATVLAVIFHYYHLSFGIVVLLAIGLTIVMLYSRRSVRRIGFVEGRFLENLNAKEKEERRLAPITSSIKEKLTGRDICVETVTVSSNSPYIGLQLKDIPFRQVFGVNIAKITRGVKVINIPSAEEHLYPADKILVIGTEAQIKIFMETMQNKSAEAVSVEEAPVTVDSFVLTAHSYMTGKTLRMIDMRNSGCMLIGVERGGESFMNPDPDFKLEENDKVWLVGDTRSYKLYV